jgi:hypothetical protein
MKTILRSCLLLLTFFCTQWSNAQVPVFNSYPSASAVLFLDFDGHRVAGTSWNANGPINCGATTLNTAQMTEVINRIAEDYRPFDLNVTTDSVKFLAAPLNKRMRVIFTVTSSWYGAAGGVAFVNSFTWGDDTPCFIFTQLLNNNVKYISEAASHEAGHTLGLYHQSTYDANCVKTSDYNFGSGSGEIGWAPIMGVGYYQNNTTWHNGPNSYGCTNYQNDINVITTNNGFAFRPDDIGETFATAAVKPFVNDQFNVDGMIATSADKDMIKFTVATTKRIVINANPKNVGNGNTGSNLDIALQLFNGATASLGVYNPTLSLNASIDTILTPGTYYLSVDGVGNTYTPEYGSLGEYSILASQIDLPTLAVRKLELKGNLNAEIHQLTWEIDADEEVTNQVLEVSTDGKNFSAVIESAATARSFGYKPYISGDAQYRLFVTFNTGQKLYSNIVTLRQTTALAKPKLIGNVVTTDYFIMSSPGAYDYTIFDVNGKTYGKGKLVNGLNSINASGVPSGMYYVLSTNNSNTSIDKFVRQ